MKTFRFDVLVTTENDVTEEQLAVKIMNALGGGATWVGVSPSEEEVK